MPGELYTDSAVGVAYPIGARNGLPIQGLQSLPGSTAVTELHEAVAGHQSEGNTHKETSC